MLGSKKKLELEEDLDLESDMDLDGMDDIDDDELTLDEEPSGNQVLQSIQTCKDDLFCYG